MLEFLKLWHKYGKEDFNYDPIPPYREWVQWMKKNAGGKPVPSTATTSRLLTRMFVSVENYRVCCANKTIEAHLAIASGDGAKVLQQKTKERTVDAEEPDLD